VTIVTALCRFAVIALTAIGECLSGKRVLRLKCEYLSKCLDEAHKREEVLKIEASKCLNEAHKREEVLKIEASKCLNEAHKREKELKIKVSKCLDDVDKREKELKIVASKNNLLPPGSAVKLFCESAERYVVIDDGKRVAVRLFVVDAGDGTIALRKAGKVASSFLRMRAGKVDVQVIDPRSVDGLKLEQPLCFDALELGDECRFYVHAVGPDEIRLCNFACSHYLYFDDYDGSLAGSPVWDSIHGTKVSRFCHFSITHS
jgi:hypothetical protein